MKIGLLSPLAAAVALLALAACAPKPVELGFIDHVGAGFAGDSRPGDRGRERH